MSEVNTGRRASVTSHPEMTSRAARSHSRVSALLQHPLTQVASAWIAIVLVGYNIALIRAAAYLHWNDFGKFYYAVLNWKGGISLYAPTIATHLTDGSQPFEFLDMNPPHFHIIMLPLLNLTLGQAGRVWMVVNAAGVVLSCWLAIRELGLRLERWHWLPLAAFCLGSTATMANSVTAQCTGVLMPLVTMAWIAARHDRWTSSGIWLGVLASIKPFLGLFLLTLAFRRQWRALLAMCGCGVLCGLSGVAVFGWRSYVEWADALGGVSWVWGGMNGSLRGLLTKALSPSPLLTPVLEVPSLIVPLWIVAVCLVSVWSLRALSWSTDHLFAVTILGSLLMSPLGWVYYLWLAVPACLALWRHRTSGFMWAGLAYQCMPLFHLGIGQPFALATVLIACAYTWATVFLWLDASSVRRTTTSTSPGLTPTRAMAPSAISTTA